MKEIWKNIKGYEGIYHISNFGRVKSLNRPYVKKDKILIPILEIKSLYNTGMYKQTELAKRFQVGQDEISRIVNNKIWRNYCGW